MYLALQKTNTDTWSAMSEKGAATGLARKPVRQMMRRARTEIGGNGGLSWDASSLESFVQHDSCQRKAFEELLRRPLPAAHRKKAEFKQYHLVPLHCESRGQPTQRGCFHHRILPARHLWPQQMLLFSDQCFPCYLGANVSGGTKSDIRAITCSSEFQRCCLDHMPLRAEVYGWHGDGVSSRTTSSFTSTYACVFTGSPLHRNNGSCIHFSFHKYLLNTYFVAGTLLGSGDHNSDQHILGISIHGILYCSWEEVKKINKCINKSLQHVKHAMKEMGLNYEE